MEFNLFTMEIILSETEVGNYFLKNISFKLDFVMEHAEGTEKIGG